jgi:hypothetical protein
MSPPWLQVRKYKERNHHSPDKGETLYYLVFCAIANIQNEGSGKNLLLMKRVFFVSVAHL